MMSNKEPPPIIARIAWHIYLFVALVLWSSAMPLPAFAASSGVDTPTGVTDLPFGIQGVQVMDLTGAGLSISSTYSGTNRTADLFISSANNPNQKLYVGINSNGGAASGDYASIEYLQESEHWGSLVLQADGGYVGVGTPSPAVPLDVYGTSGGRVAYFTGPSSSVNVIDIGYGGGSNQAVELGYEPNGNYGYLAVLGGSPTINLLSNGNVGIATTTPKYTLDVTGNVHVAPGYNFIVGDVSDVSTGGAAFSYNGTYGQLYAINQGVVWQNIILGGGAPGTGNVGIANASPQTTLDVNGGIRAGSAATGTGCSPEGTLGYDYSAHVPVYCSQSGVWTASGCGKPYMQIANCSGYSTNAWMSRCASVQICSTGCGCSSAQYGDGVLYATPGY